MKLIPSSTAQRRTAVAPSGSAGGPQIPWPVIRIAPKPRRRSSSSPPSATVPAADASVLSSGIPLRLPGVLFLFVGEGELDVGPGDRDKRAGLGRAAVQGRELGVDEGDEVEIAPVQVVGEAAAVALARQGEIADDPVSVGLQYHALPPRLHALTLAAPRLFSSGNFSRDGGPSRSALAALRGASPGPPGPCPGGCRGPS